MTDGTRLEFHERGHPASLVIRGNVTIHPTARLWTDCGASSFVTRGDGRIVVGARTFVNCACWVRAAESVVIGDACMIGPRVAIQDSDAHAVDGLHVAGGESAPVRIGDHAFVGLGAIVLKGVRVGEGAVVGAGAVVTRDVRPWTMVAGNPARFVRAVRRPV